MVNERQKRRQKTNTAKQLRQCLEEARCKAPIDVANMIFNELQPNEKAQLLELLLPSGDAKREVAAAHLKSEVIYRMINLDSKDVRCALNNAAAAIIPSTRKSRQLFGKGSISPMEKP